MKRPAPLTWEQATVTRPLDRPGYRFVIPVTGSGNRMWRKGKGRTYKHAEHAGNCEQAALRFRRVAPLVGDVAVVICWYRAARVGDIDNRTKTTLDVLKGIAFVDDKQVSELRVVRVDDEREPARLVVDVWPMGRVAT